VGMQGLASASIAYLHAVQYAKERLQGSHLAEFTNPEAPRVPIIVHPDVRRMLLWMKAHVDGMRAMAYYTALCLDKHAVSADEAEREKSIAIVEILTPLLKAYNSDVGFRVTEFAMQVYGGYGYCSEYPIEQFLRDAKIASIYEGTNGIQSLDLVARKLGMKKGQYLMHLLGEMNGVINRYQAALPDLAGEAQASVNVLADMAMYFAACAKAGKFMVPVNNAYPFMNMMGKIMLGWFLYWEAGVAKVKLDALCQTRGVDPAKVDELAKENQDAAFYIGKLASARYYFRNVLPEVDAAVKAIKNEDMTIVEIPVESFASA